MNPADIRPADDILRDAADMFARYDAAHAELRRCEAELTALCRQYDSATRHWGYAPHHLRRAVEIRFGGVAA
jgi:hypothetical protein